MDLPEEQTCQAKQFQLFHKCGIFILFAFYFILTISSRPRSCAAGTGQAKEKIGNVVTQMLRVLD